MERSDSIPRKIFTCESSPDLTILLGNGAEIKCHREIVAAGSPVLAAMMNGLKGSGTSTIEIKEVSEEAITLLLQYLYGGEFNAGVLGCEVALELLQVAHKYELLQLKQNLGQLFLHREKAWYTPSVLMELYLFVRKLEGYGELKGKALQVMTIFLNDVKSCDMVNKLNNNEFVDPLWKMQ